MWAFTPSAGQIQRVSRTQQRIFSSPPLCKNPRAAVIRWNGTDAREKLKEISNQPANLYFDVKESPRMSGKSSSRSG